MMSVIRQRILMPSAALLLPAYLSACFRYVSTDADPLPSPRSEVKVHLASPIEVPLGEVTLRDVTIIEGVVSDADSDSLGVFGKWLYPQVGTKYDAMGASFRVGKQDISTVDHYRFSAPRTAIAVAVTGVVIAGFMQLIGLADFGGGDVTPPPVQTSVRGWRVR